MKSRRKQQGVK